MLDDYDKISRASESPIKIGKITYCVLAAIPTVIVLFAIYYDTIINNLYTGFLILFVFAIFNLPLILIGVVNVFRNRREGLSNSFWYFANALSIWPIIWFVVRLAFETWH